MTKQTSLILIIILIFAVFSPIAYWHFVSPGTIETPLFFGVSFGGKTADEAKLLVDEVKGTPTFFSLPHGI
jgi:uncharacterized membrane protein YphA (DoxX/SURF4 family)